MHPVIVGPTINRSVVGIMVDFANLLPHFLQASTWDDRALRQAEDLLAGNPCFAGTPPDRLPA